MIAAIALPIFIVVYSVVVLHILTRQVGHLRATGLTETSAISRFDLDGLERALAGKASLPLPSVEP
jgi:hypothetical protein